MREDLHIAIAGATGAVGVEMIKVLERRNFPVGKLTPLASARSVGKTVTFRGEDIPVLELTENSFEGVDIVLFSAGGGTSMKFAPVAANAGAVVVDNSSAFRMDDSVPLVVPEINPDDVATHNGIIANPNCSTIVTVMALYPLHQIFGVRRIFASTYQAVSGSGAMGIAELERQVGEINAGNEASLDVYPHQIAFNVLPHVDVFLDDGYTKEEMKMVHESRKIMSLPSFRASVTCVRVPVYRAHSIAVNAEFDKPVSVEEAREAINAAPGIDLNDDVAANGYPLPLELAGKDNCQVGRIRNDCAMENGLSFWVVGDQLLKGAALNTVQIAEEVAKL
ncbi:MAG TPA: aspartate-semialdehyde dehydrogenase [Verrucomicrobiota bacterium]|nr:aspartate-semialdehyde dehydrogenase [Verrucomicrobiota bacterium]